MTTGVTSDEIAELVDLVRRGDSDAGFYLVSVCGARLEQYARLLAGHDMSPSQLDDACATAVERAISHIDKYDPGRGSFLGWLRGHLRFVVLEHRRHNLETTTDPALLGQAAYRDPCEPSTEVSDAVAMIVTQLPETDQLLLRLRHDEQLDYESIAQVLGVNAATCRQRHRRSLAKIRELAAHNDVLAAYTKEQP